MTHPHDAKLFIRCGAMRSPITGACLTGDSAFAALCPSMEGNYRQAGQGRGRDANAPVTRGVPKTDSLAAAWAADPLNLLAAGATTPWEFPPQRAGHDPARRSCCGLAASFVQPSEPQPCAASLNSPTAALVARGGKRQFKVPFQFNVSEDKGAVAVGQLSTITSTARICSRMSNLDTLIVQLWTISRHSRACLI
jgi:hypothetical protein